MNDEVKYEDSVSEEIVISIEARRYLSEAAKWAKFLSIIGFIGLVIMVLASFFMGNLMNLYMKSMYMSVGMQPVTFSSTPFFCAYLILAVIYFFPIYYLYNFSKYLRQALNGQGHTELTMAFLNLKSHYKYLGILTIVVFSLYVFVFIGAIIMVAAIGAMGH